MVRRAGEWRVLLLVLLVLLVGNLAMVGQFVDHVRQALQQQAGGLAVVKGDEVESACNVIQLKGDEHGQARNN